MTEKDFVKIATALFHSSGHVVNGRLKVDFELVLSQLALYMEEEPRYAYNPEEHTLSFPKGPDDIGKTKGRV